MPGAITDVPGITVGHYTDRRGATGCTVVLCEEGAVGGVDIRGSAPGTRETDLLRPLNLVQQAHGILLSGGSAFGLDAAGGVMRYLEERGIGFKVGQAVVPIVAGAILFDLGVMTHKARPDQESGYRACLAAGARAPQEGSVGAGTGATVGKALGLRRATKGGIGTASVRLGKGVVVGAIVAVNALGDVVDPNNGKHLAGPRKARRKGFHNTAELLREGKGPSTATAATNTTIGVVATNVPLNKEQANKLALFAQDGLALTVRPCHTMGDGDAFFTLATGKSKEPVEMNCLGVAAVIATSEAIMRAVLKAKGLGGIPSAREVMGDDFPQR